MGLTAANKDICSEASGHKVVPLGPNTCKTPGSPPVPLPYPLTGDTSQLDPGCKKVVVGSGKQTLTTKGKIKRVMGNAPGSLKDITSSQTMGHVDMKSGVPGVFFEGGEVCVTGSRCGLNS